MKRLFVLLALALCPSWLYAKPLQVFVSVLPQQNFVERIGGDHVVVHTMVTPGNSPATYNPTPQQIGALEQADLYIRIGVPFENAWMKRIRSANPNMQIIDARKSIDLRSIEEHHHAGHHHHDHAEELDPHIWTSPPLVKQIAHTVLDALIEQAPQQETEFRQNYQSFASDLDALDAELTTTFANRKGLKFLVFHPSWGYFADTYGLEQVAIEKEGKQPGARALANLIEHAKSDGISIIFVQPQFDKKLANQIAKAIDGKVIAIDPLSPDYLSNMRKVATQMSETLPQ